MSLVEEELPGVSKVKKDFQMREDFALAKKIQDDEFESHYTGNVHMRREAMRSAKQDVQVAKKLQMHEVHEYREFERQRSEQLMAQEQEAKRMQERIDREHQQAEEIRRRDEEYMRRLRQQEAEKQQKTQRDLQLQEDAARRLQKLEIAGKAPNPSSEFDLPSYDSLGFEDDAGEVVEDENERQERLDAELARRLMEEEKKQAGRPRPTGHEDTDAAFARRLQQELEGGASEARHHASDMEMARRLHHEAHRQQSEQELADMELARRLSENDFGPPKDDQMLTDFELAKQIQKEELLVHKREVKKRQKQQQYPHPEQSLPPASSLPTQSLGSPSRSVPASFPSQAPSSSLPAGQTVSLGSLQSGATEPNPMARQAYKRSAQAGSKDKKGKKK